MVGNKSADELHGRQKKLDVKRYKQKRALPILEINERYIDRKLQFLSSVFSFVVRRFA